MPLGQYRHYVTLDNPNGIGGGYAPLSPPDWYCGVVSESDGGAVLVGPYHPGISQATRIHLRGRTLHVDTLVNSGERDVELTLACSLVQP